MKTKTMLYREALEDLALRYLSMAKEEDIITFINEFDSKIHEYSLEKLNRWLGYIQGVLIERGYTTVEKERNFTREYFKDLDEEGWA